MKVIRVTTGYEHFLTHLDVNELNEIQNRIERNASAAFIFYKDGKEKFCAIIDFDDVSVHLRHLGGPFAWCGKHIYELTLILAKRTGLNYITVIPNKHMTAYLIKRMGFTETETKNLYEKAV